MGYESTLHLIDVKIKAEAVPEVTRALADPGKRGTTRFAYILERALLDRDGFLVFKASEDGPDPYDPDEEDSTVPALYGKWYGAEHFARWLSRHCEREGRIVLHSIEADGCAWGWEFDGRGRMRALDLVPVGKWT
jgi:hypothetical protein